MQMRLQLALLGAMLSSAATANTVTQNLSWTINRSGATQKVRVVAYGDSMFAGYYGSISSVAKRAAPSVDADYAQKLWNANVEIYRRAKSGAVASDIYNNKIVAEKSYMQAANTRIVMFEMCGNDFLQARSSFGKQTGTCSYAPLDTALANCTVYQEKAMQFINANAPAGALKLIANLYYPGYDADNASSGCLDAGTGAPVNKQEKFLPYIARANFRACKLAAQYGFACADIFAQYMGADYDSNGDGAVDSDALAWKAPETEDEYVARITQPPLRSTLRDANTHFVNASTSYDYILSDNTHPTYTGPKVSVGFFGGTGTGSGAPDYTDADIVSGKNPVWNQLGHERMGWGISQFTPAP
jgi:lysophospholipase L1-like esterase